MILMSFIEILDLLQQVFLFLGYFNSSNSFPDPLSKEEEQACFISLKKKQSEDAREKLIAHNLRLVAYVCKKYSTCSIDQDDLLSIGTIGLIKSINTYDYEKGTKFATYAARCIDNEILMAIRSESKLSGNVFLEDIIGVDDEGNNISLIDVLDNQERDIEDQVNLKLETVQMLKQVNQSLSSRERLVVKMRYGLGGTKKYTQLQISEMLGISRSYVSRIEKKAVEKLSDALKKVH